MKYSNLSDYHVNRLVMHNSFPWNHWDIKDFFSTDYLTYFKAILPEDLNPDLVYDKNRSAMRLTRKACVKFPFLEKIVQYFQQPSTIKFFEGKSKEGFFKDCYVRIDYTLDHPGYYLAPHLDRHSKLLTFQVYLPESEEKWGTEIYNNRGGDMILSRTIPFIRNYGYFFFPGLNPDDRRKWHGVTKEVTADRPSIIINYMTKPEKLDAIKGDDNLSGGNVQLAEGANEWEEWWSL